MFPGNERDFADRTSLTLNTGKLNPDEGKFNLRFEYTPHNIMSPGYIFLLSDSKGDEAYNLIYTTTDSISRFILGRDGRRHLYSADFPFKDMARAHLPIEVEFDFNEGTARISIGELKSPTLDLGRDTKSPFFPELHFGMTGHILETASFSIRNLELSDGKAQIRYPLDESDGITVHDSEGNDAGSVCNPHWMINKSYYWTKVTEHRADHQTGCAFDPDNNRFVLYDRDSVRIFDLITRESTSKPYIAPEYSHPVRLGMSITPPGGNTIYPYELNWLDTYISRLNPDSGIWETIGDHAPALELHHHSAAYLTDRSELLIFGGYGNRRYYNDFITYDFVNSGWDTLSSQF